MRAKFRIPCKELSLDTRVHLFEKQAEFFLADLAGPVYVNQLEHLCGGCNEWRGRGANPHKASE